MSKRGGREKGRDTFGQGRVAKASIG